MSNPSKVQTADFTEVLSAIAEVDHLKSRQEVLAHEADIETRKEDVAARIREVYSRQGISVTDAVIKSGVDAYFDQRLRLEYDSLGLLKYVAAGWMERRLIAMNLGLFCVAAILSTLTWNWWVQHRNEQITSEYHAAVAAWGDQTVLSDNAERSFNDTYKEVTSKIQKTTALSAELANAASVALNQLVEVRARFQVLDNGCSTYRYSEAVKIDDAKLLQDLESEKAIILARENAGKMEVVAKYGAAFTNELLRIGSKFDSLSSECGLLANAWSGFIASHPSEATMDRIGPAHDKGLQVIRSFGGITEVTDARRTIETAVADISRLNAYPEEITTAAEHAKTLAVEAAAITEIEYIARESLAAVKAGNVIAADNGVRELKKIAEELNRSYEIKIVNRSDEYTRVWYNNPTNTGKLFYIIVEAVSEAGDRLSLPILNEQSGQTQTVSRWAERVDEATYEAVGSDKKDDGVIQNDKFGAKKRGYLTPSYLIGPKTTGGDVAKGRFYGWPRK